MEIAALGERLRAEGYGELLRSGPRFLAIGDYCLCGREDRLRLGWTERGAFTDIELETMDEAAACAAFHARVAARPLFLADDADPERADRLSGALRRVGIEVWRNDIPAGAVPDLPRFRLFVRGRDLAAARAIAAADR